VPAEADAGEGTVNGLEVVCRSVSYLSPQQVVVFQDRYVLALTPSLE
jgi:hypothetical protein